MGQGDRPFPPKHTAGRGAEPAGVMYFSLTRATLLVKADSKLTLLPLPVPARCTGDATTRTASGWR